MLHNNTSGRARSLLAARALVFAILVSLMDPPPGVASPTPSPVPSRGAPAPVYVSAITGNDANPGTQALPLQTIGAGLALADSGGRPLYIAAGNYNEIVNLHTGINLWGGFHPLTWQHDIAVNITRIVGNNRPLRGDTINTARIDGCTIECTSPAGAGGSAIAALLSTCADVAFTRCKFVAAAGNAGGSGSSGPAGVSGNTGVAGTPGCEDSGFGCSSCGQPQGGAGGTSAVGSTGGRGGNAGHDGNNGGAGVNGSIGGLPNGGAAGTGTPPHQGNWSPPQVPYWGVNGASGTPGTDGTGGASLGTISATGYMPANGSAGANGTNGAGGGGGGGGGGGETNCDSYGSSGGGGGGGGGAGTHGNQGNGGGASIALTLINCPGIIVNQCALTTGNGGNGGAGGTGGNGGNGGNGGLGGQYGGGGEQDDGSNGARGGNGGNGGRGGHGGGGGGGPSIGIIVVGNNAVQILGDTFTIGNAGNGGASSGFAGANGVALNISGLSAPATPDCNNNGMLDQFDIADGTSGDANGNGIPDECEAPTCPADIAPAPNGNGVVNVDDLLLVITSWGPCPNPCPPHCAADIAPAGGNCAVNVDDLLLVITHWGPCP